MSFPMDNIESISINDMPAFDKVKKIEEGRVVNITTSFKNAQGQYKTFLGQFVKYDLVGRTYKVTIRVPTEYHSLSNVQLYEEKAIWGSAILKIDLY